MATNVKTTKSGWRRLHLNMRPDVEQAVSIFAAKNNLTKQDALDLLLRSELKLRKPNKYKSK